MEASTVNPIYTAVAVTKSGTKYNLNNVTYDLTLTESDGELAQKAELTIKNIKAGNEASGYLAGTIVPGVRLYVFANDGSGKKEKFRGVIWDKSYEGSAEKKLTYTAYDHLIYLQKSKGCEYFSAGKKSKDIISAICKKWGLKLTYSYDSIKHSKLPLNNKNISDMIIEVLDAVKKKKGTKYVIKSSKDVMYIKKYGTNSSIYTFEKKKDVISTKTSMSMEGMVTKVIITGKEDKSKRKPIVATVKSDKIKTYGTLQEIVSKDEGTTLAEAKKEANQLLKDKAKLTRTYSLEAPDIPWITKGDLIKISASDMKGSYYVIGISHNCNSKTMSLEVEPK